MEEKDKKDPYCGFHYYFRNIENEDNGDPHTDKEAPKRPPKLEKKKNTFFDYSLLISQKFTQIVHFCKAVISNFKLYLQ